MEISGKLKKIQNVETYNEFRKQGVIIETEEKYPQLILVEFQNKNIDNLAKFKEGQNVTIGINIRGKEWLSPKGETKYFNTIVGWQIKASENAKPYVNDTPVNVTAEEEIDDLPF